MTSKEAFEKIREIMEQYHHQFVKDNIKLETIEGYPINKIEKDLELLEILKKYISIFENPNTVEKFRYVYTSGYITKEEYDLLKEWLENE